MVGRSKRAPGKPAKRAPRAVSQADKPTQPERTPRERMVLAAVSLLSERGLEGTSFSEVIERSGAPRGSIYHHFPDGKDTLAAEAVALVGRHTLGTLRHFEGATPALVVRRFVDGWRQLLLRSDFKAGCAIAAVANSRLEHPELGERAAAVLISFERGLSDALINAGMAREKAAVAAPLVLAACEGALILCRARRDIAPLEAVDVALASYVAG